MKSGILKALFLLGTALGPLAPAASTQSSLQPWQAHDVSTSTVMAFSVSPADVDGDGDMDVFSAGFNDTISWHENVETDGRLWVEHVIAPAVFVFTVDAVDLDGDGDLDVAVGSTSLTEPLTWFENRFGDGSAWIKNIVPAPPVTIRSVHGADVDADGDMDLLSALEDGDAVVLSKNLNGTGTSWASGQVGQGDGPLDVETADVDGNGTLDVLTIYSQETRVAWYSNQEGDGSLWFEVDMMLSGQGGHSVSPGDMNGDGDMDAVSGSFGNDLLVFHRNRNGTALDWSNEVISTQIGNYVSVEVADLDLDGDLDVLAASFDNLESKGVGTGAMTVTWQENLLGSPVSWQEHTVSDTVAKGRAALVADMDQDCDLDVVAATSTNDRVAWFENTVSLDCNSNGVPDACDIAQGASIDCNKNGVPDECDFFIDGSDQISINLGGIDFKPWMGGPNGIPDECEFPILDQLLQGLPRTGSILELLPRWSEVLGDSVVGAVGFGDPLVQQAVQPGDKLPRERRLELPLQVLGGVPEGKLLVYAYVEDALQGSQRLGLDQHGGAELSLRLAAQTEWPLLGAGGVLTVRAVELDSDGRPFNWSAPLHLPIKNSAASRAAVSISADAGR